MIVVRFLRVFLMYQPGETAGFDAPLARDLIARGIAVDPDAVAVPSLPEETATVPLTVSGADVRAAVIEGVILALEDDDYTQAGKPDVDAINAAMPADFDRVTAAERDAVWTGMQGDA